MTLEFAVKGAHRSSFFATTGPGRGGFDFPQRFEHPTVQQQIGAEEQNRIGPQDLESNPVHQVSRPVLYRFNRAKKRNRSQGLIVELDLSFLHQLSVGQNLSPGLRHFPLTVACPRAKDGLIVR